MSAYDNPVINLADSRIADFFRNHKPGTFDGKTVELTPDDAIKNHGMVWAADRAEPGMVGQMPLFSAVRRTYSIIQKLGFPGTPGNLPPSSGSMEVHQCHLNLPVTNLVKIFVKTVLAVVPNSLVAAEIEASFKQFNPLNDGDVELYIAKKVSELIPKEPIVQEKFALFTHISVEFISSTVDERQEERLYNLYRNNSEGVSIPGVLVGDKQKLEDFGFRIKLLSEQYLADLPIPTSSGEGLIVVPVGTDEAIKLKAVSDKSVVTGTDCQGLVDVTPVKVASTPMLPGTKVVWEWRYIKACGGGFHFWKPIKYTREQETVYYVTLWYTVKVEAVVDILKSCLNDAARDTVILSILTSDFENAFELFIHLFMDKVKERLHRLYDCVFPKLYVVVEQSEWHE